MNATSKLLLVAILMGPTALAVNSPIAGTWTAGLHDQPAIKLTVEDHEGKLSGNLIFYFLMLEGGAWKVKGAEPVDLINPRMEGQSFVFEVPHARKHGSTDPADQEIKTFRLQLTGENEAVFPNASDGNDLILRRTAEPIAGTWRGKIYDLPGVVLTVSDDGGKFSGTIIFYFLHRNTEHASWEVDTTHLTALPLLDPKFDGKILSFQVSHKEAHPPRTLNDPPSSFQMRLTGKDEGELLNLTEKQSPGVKMARDSR
jgi:hypothetical protein